METMTLELQNEHSLLQSLYGALTDREGFHGFLEKLVGIINGCASQLLVVRKHPLQMDHLWYHGLSGEFLSWYLENNMISQDVVTNQAVNQPRSVSVCPAPTPGFPARRRLFPVGK